MSTWYEGGGWWGGASATSSFTMRLRNGARSAAAMTITSAGSRARTSPWERE